MLRVFSEVCWGLCELRRESDGGAGGHQLLVYKMRNVSLERSRFPFRIGGQGIVGQDAAPAASPPRPVQPTAPGGADDEPKLLDEDALADLEAAVRLRSGSRAGVVPPPPKRARVLVAAADTGMRHLVIGAFGDEIELIEASDGETALALATERQPDLLVLHAALARVNAAGVCRILRAQGGDAPLIFLAGSPTRPCDRTRWLELGADDVLETRFEPAELLVRARRLLDRRGGVPPTWPRFDAAEEIKKLGPQHLDPAELDAHVGEAATRARAHGLPLALLGYEFRFVDGPEGAQFVERFAETVAGAMRAGDALSRVSEKRLVALLLDADADGARRVVQRVHERILAGGRRRAARAA